MESLISELKLADAITTNNTTALSRLDAFPLPVYVTSASGHILYHNTAATELWGRAPALGRDIWCGSWDMYTTDGKFMPHEACPMGLTLKENRAIRGVEAIGVRPDGSSYRFMPFPTPVRDTNGKLVGAVNMLIHLAEEVMAVDVPEIAIVGANP